MSPPRENLRVSRSVVDEIQEPIGGLVGEIQDTNLRSSRQPRTGSPADGMASEVQNNGAVYQ